MKVILLSRDPIDCSPPGSSTHGIFQARVLEWGAIAFSASGGLTSIYSNFSAHSGLIERQVHLVNWFQGAGIRQKVNGQQVRLLLGSPSSRLSPPKRMELPLVSQPSSPVFSAPQRDKKDRACQNQGSVFISSMSFQTRKKSHRTKVKTRGP